jgi:MFS family permease
MSTSAATGSGPRFDGWRMVALACLSTNVASGFTFAAYSTFMSPMATQFGASRSLASAGLSIMVAALGLAAPVASYAVRRWSIRATFAAGYIFLSAGWALMSIAINAWQFVLAFGLLCGAAGACLMVVPPMTLVNNWFVALRGRAAGIVMVPVALVLLPPLAATGIATHGWRATALAMSLVTLVMTPITRWVVDRPEDIGQKALGAGEASTREEERVAPSDAVQQSPVREPVFWLIMCCAGLIGGANVAFAGHLIAFAVGKGIALRNAAFLFTIFGSAGLAGAFLSGLLADRIGGARSFALVCFLECIAWPCMLLPFGYGFLAFWVAVTGLCANSMLPICTPLFANVFGRERFARVMGLYSLTTMPFNFILPLLAGILYDVFGSYRAVFLIYAGLFGLAGILICFVHRTEVAQQRRSSSTERMVAAH